MKQLGALTGWIVGWAWIPVSLGLVTWFLIDNGWGWLLFFASGALLVISALVIVGVMQIKGEFANLCPYCKERIKDGARVCKHCGSDLTKDPTE